ncbi:MAG TPA: hypothetical protein VGL75_10660 [Acidothermaceae bacterium]|jgi:hypothetical protein
MSLNAEVLALVAAACQAGSVNDERDLNLVESLAVEVIAEGNGYRRGWSDALAAIRGASNDVAQAANWPRIASELADARRSRAYRVKLCDPSPRPGDYPGRRTA